MKRVWKRKRNTSSTLWRSLFVEPTLKLRYVFWRKIIIPRRFDYLFQIAISGLMAFSRVGGYIAKSIQRRKVLFSICAVLDTLSLIKGFFVFVAYVEDNPKNTSPVFFADVGNPSFVDKELVASQLCGLYFFGARSALWLRHLLGIHIRTVCKVTPHILFASMCHNSTYRTLESNLRPISRSSISQNLLHNR